MDIAKQDIAAIVQISGQIWVITNSGQWIPAQEVTSSLANIEVITLTAEQIDLNAEQPQVFVNGQWLTLPSQVITSITTINENNQPPTANRATIKQSTKRQ
ncbi:hypothetical protein [Pseudoalteromonas sp.]|uniref:hypothetical protein n=1 Tax=Pseudoalteromonas sp. TaxID=53249 RepID=UPI003002F477